MKELSELTKELEDATLLYGEKHDFVARIHNEIGNFYFTNDELKKAMESYRKAEKIYTDLHGLDCEMVIDLHYRVGKVMESMSALGNNNDTEVKKHFKNTLLMRQHFDSVAAKVEKENEITALTSAHIDPMDSTMIYNDMAESARNSGKFDEALPLYIKSIELRRKKFGVTSSAVCPVLVNYAELLKQLDRFGEAKLVLEEALAISIKSYGKKHAAVAECINNLGQIFRLLGDVEKGESLLLEALQLRRELFGDIDELVAETLNNLADLYREKGDYLQAINYHKISIEAFTKSVGADHPGTVNAKGNLGITYRRFSKVNMNEGEALLHDAVQYMQERDYNPKHPWLLKFGNEHILTQAQRLADQGKHEQSLELFDTVLHKKKAMEAISSGVNKSFSRPMSPEAVSQDIQLIAEGKVIGMVGKAKNLIRKGKYLEADKLLQEIANQQQNQSKSIAIDVTILRAENHFLLGNFNLVAPFYTEALNARIDLYGPDSVKLVEIMVGLADYFRSQAEYDQAAVFYNQATKLITFATTNDMQTIGSHDMEHIRLNILASLGASELQRNLGNYSIAAEILDPLAGMCMVNSFEEDPILADCFSSLAALEFVKGEYSKAMDLYREVIEIRTKNYGRNHPKTASTLCHMGRVEMMLCNHDAASRLFDEALNIQLHFFTKSHPAIATTYFRKSKLATELGKYQEASQYMADCLAARKELLGESHPAVAQSMSALAEILSESFALKEALEQHEKALNILNAVFSTGQNHALIISTSFAMAKTLHRMSRFNEAVAVFETCLNMQQLQMDSFKVNQHLLFVEISLAYSETLLTVGRVSEAAEIVGKCGVTIFSLFKEERHFKTAECLYHLANVSKAKGRYKDAKYQYSLALAIKNKNILLPHNHKDICKILFAAADNMRVVGYFHDAFEACSTLETFVSTLQCENTEKEIHQMIVSLLHANILVDRGKATMAESLYEAALKMITTVFGEKSVQFLDIKIGLARCYQQQNKIYQAEKCFVEAHEIAVEVLGLRSPVTFDVMSSMYFIKTFLNTKPQEQSKAVDALVEEVMPFYSEGLGIAHPYTVHTRGRIGIFMNKAKKDSGRKMIFDALKVFDRYKQFAFTYDHPWILEMGGFESKPNVKERLSHLVEEFALAPWSMPSYEGDRAFGVVPKHIFIDLKNFAEEAWGSVQFYGVDKHSSDATGGASDNVQPSPFARLRLSKSVARRVIPAATLVTATSAFGGSIANSTESAVAIPDTGVADEAAAQARKELEDRLHTEQEIRRDMEDMLLHEREKLSNTSEMLAKEMNNRFQLEQNLMMQNEELQSTKVALLEAKHLLHPPEITFAINPVQVIEDIDASSVEAEFQVKEELTDEEILQLITDVKVRSQIDASGFLFDRAMELYESGWFRQARPLFQECFLVRDKYIQRVTITGDTLFFLAKNLSNCGEWTAANEKLSLYLRLRDSHAYTGGALKFVEAIMAQGVNFTNRGMIREGAEKYIDATKLILAIPDGASHPLLGEILSNQALNTLHTGKFMDAKAMAERGQAILAKAFGGGNVLTTQAVYVKAEVLRVSGKYKESAVLIEQTLVSRRRRYGESHPLIADCLLCFGICLLQMAKHSEAEKKLDLALAMRQQYFIEEKVHDNDLRVAEVIYWKGVLQCLLGQYENSIQLHEKSLQMQLTCLDVTEKYLDTTFEVKTVKKPAMKRLSSANKEAIVPMNLISSDKPVMVISDSYLALAKVYVEIGRFDVAESYVTKALNIRVGINPGDDAFHFKIIECHLVLAQLNRLRGNYQVEKSLVPLLSNDGLRNAVGKENPLYYSCQQELADWYRDTREISQASNIGAVVLEWRLEAVGDEHPEYAESLLSFAECLRLVGKFRKASETVKTALSIFKMTFGDLPDGHVWLTRCLMLEADIALSVFESPIEEEPEPEPPKAVAAEDSDADEEMKKESDQTESSNTAENKVVSDNEDDKDKTTTEATIDQPGEPDVENDSSNGLIQNESVEQEKEEVLPMFDNSKFVALTNGFKSAAQMLQSLLLPVAKRLLDGENLTQSESSTAMIPLSAHPMLQFLRACMGAISLHEHRKRQEFYDALSPEVQQAVKAEELMRKRKAREMAGSPSGLEELNTAIQDMFRVPLNESHIWLQRFQLIVKEFTFVLDPMEIASNDYLAAEIFRKDGNYFAADEKYDSAFTTQLNHLGATSAASNILVADTLLGKAENCRLLGNISLARTLYTQSSIIYRKCQGVDSEGVVRCTFGIAQLLYSLGLYDEANSMFLHVESQWIRFYSEESIEYNQVRTALAYTNWKLGNFEKALDLASLALNYFKKVFRSDMGRFDDAWKKLQEQQQLLQIQDEQNKKSEIEFEGKRVECDLVNTYLCIAYILSSTGQFEKAMNVIAGSKKTLEKFQKSLRLKEILRDGPPQSTELEDHYQLADVLQCEVDISLKMGQVRDASKTIMKVMKFRIRDFSKTAHTVFSTNESLERRTSFFDAYDLLVQETASKIIAAPTKKTKKTEDQDLEDSNAEDDITIDNIELEDQSLPSVTRFNPIVTPPIFVYKNIPVISHPDIIECLLTRGKICAEMTEYSDAKEMFDAALRMMSKLLPNKQSLRKLSIVFEQANLTYLRGSFDESKMMHTTILQHRLQLCDEFHPDKASSLYALAVNGITMCKYDDCTQILAETLKIRKKSFGDQHWNVGEVYMSCAEVLGGKGLYADSNAFYEKALKIFQATFGDLHPLLARANVGHACNMRDMGSVDFALSLVDQAIAAQSIIYGDQHPAVANSLFCKASILRNQGRCLETKRVLDQVIACQREKLGKQHPLTVGTLLAVAFNYMDLAKYATAGQVFERTNQLLRKFYGKDHALVAIGLVGLAETFRCKGMYKKAQESHEAALYMRRKILGEKHPAVAESIYFLAELHLICFRLDDATRAFDDALALQRMALGNAHPDIALTIQGLGKTQLARGKVIEARGTHERALAMKKSVLPAEHPSIGDSQFLIAQVYRKLGKLDQASALLERCASAVKDSRGSRHPLVGAILYHAAEVANTLGKLDYAGDLYMESLRIRMGVFREVNEDHPEVAESYFGVAENLRSIGIYDVAKAKSNVTGYGKQHNVSNAEIVGNNGDTDIEDVNNSRSVVDSILDGDDRINNDLEGSKSFVESKTELPTENNTRDDFSASLQREEIGNNVSNMPGNDNVEIISQYKAALPLYEKVLAQLQTVESFEPGHPVILSVRFSIAETKRCLGKFEEASAIFDDVLSQRRKLLGDNHPDTIQSMYGMGEVLRSMGKNFADNPSGSVEAKEIKKAMTSVLSGVTLMDHLKSIVATPPPLLSSSSGSRPETSSSSLGSSKKMNKSASQEGKWSFISQPESTQRKKTALKIPRGYMGYEFPKDKQLSKSDLPTGNAAGGSKVKKINAGDAKLLYDGGLAAQKVVFGGSVIEHPMTAALLYAKGELLRARKNNKEALQFFEQSLAMRRRLFRGTHPSIADCLNSMAEVFRVENKFSQAAPMYEKALEIRIEAYSGRHPCISEVKNNIAMLQYAQGNYPEAQRLLEDALFMCEELLGPMHPATAISLNNLAGLLHSCGNYEAALPIYNRSLKIKEKAFGADHPDVASTLNNIGLLYKMQGNFEDAQHNFEQALEMQKKLYGPVHADVATSLNNLAALYGSQGKYYDAKELYKQAIAMRSTIFGLDHQTVAATYNNYGGLMYAIKEFDTARDLFESSLKIKIKLYGDGHPSIAETMNNIGLVMFAQGQIKESIPIFERALAIKTNAYGLENPTIASAIFTVGGLYHKAGEFDKAKEKYLEAREIRFGLFGGRHKDTKLCDDVLAALEKDKLKATTRESKLKSSLRSQVPSARIGGLATDTPVKNLKEVEGSSPAQHLLLNDMESSMYQEEGNKPQFD